MQFVSDSSPVLKTCMHSPLEGVLLSLGDTLVDVIAKVNKVRDLSHQGIDCDGQALTGLGELPPRQSRQLPRGPSIEGGPRRGDNGS